MIRSKASAALLRLKEIDKKYRVRYEEPKDEISSDNTESLIRQPIESKNNTPSVLLTEEQEILKPTLSIKIPDTFTEQLESQSSSNEVSPSVRVSIVDKTPIVDPIIESESVSEIEEELEDAESISEMINYSDNSASVIAEKNPNEEIEQSKTKDSRSAIARINLSMEDKQLENFLSGSNDAHSNNYSHCSFESYSSVSESQLNSLSKSEVHEANNSISAINTNRNDASFSSEGILESRKFAESREKKNEEETGKFEECIEKKNEEITGKFVESIEKKNEEITGKFVESIEKKNEEITGKFVESIEKKNEEITAKFVESIEKKNEEITAKFSASIEKDKTVKPEDTNEIVEEVIESFESVEATDLFATNSGDSESVADKPHKKFKSKQNRKKYLKMKKPKNQEETSSTNDENSSDTKLPREESNKKNLKIKDRQKKEQLSSCLKNSNSSLKKLDKNINKQEVLKINDELKSEKQLIFLNSKILSHEKSERRKNKLKNCENGISENSEISSSSLLDTNSSMTKSSRNQSRATDLEFDDETEKEEIFSSSKENFSHQKLDNNETAFLSRTNRTKHSSQLLRGPRRFRKKSSDYSEEVGNLPEVDDELSKFRSRRINSQRKFQHRYLALRQNDAEKGFFKSEDKTVQKSQSAVEIEEKREEINPTIIRRKKIHQNSKVYGYINEKKTETKTSKSSTSCRINELLHTRKDMELERFNMRLRDLRLEQERQLMLCYMRDFQEDREQLLLWPKKFYCPGKSEAAIIKPLNFPNILKFVKPDSTAEKIGLNFPDNHLAMLKNRVIEIRQWLKDQFILYQDYNDVATAINAKYVAENEKAVVTP